MYTSYFEKIKHYFEKYERHIGFGFLLAGFIFDNLTLRRIDLLVDNVLIIFYLFVAAISILLLNIPNFRYKHIAIYVMQFVFGGLFSVYVVFYSRGSNFLISWPFLLMLVIFFIGNEFFRKKYEQLNFHLAIFFVALFSYTIFSLPILLNLLGPDVFVLSGILSIVVFVSLLYVLKYFIGEQLFQKRRLILGTILIIFIAFNVFYFTNIIPPLPLSLVELGVYHGVLKTDEGNYVLLGEYRAWYEIFQSKKLHLVSGSSVYAYAVVFAPTDISVKIFHHWSFYDQNKKTWVEVSRIGYSISGGRDKGYRGYTIEENTKPGRWRIEVTTDRGQVIGKDEFEIVAVDRKPELVEEVH